MRVSQAYQEAGAKRRGQRGVGGRDHISYFIAKRGKMQAQSAELFWLTGRRPLLTNPERKRASEGIVGGLQSHSVPARRSAIPSLALRVSEARWPIARRFPIPAAPPRSATNRDAPRPRSPSRTR